jgi:HSP20 family protein
MKRDQETKLQENRNVETQNGGQDGGGSGEQRAARATPVCDVWESQDVVHVLAEMPGVDPQSVEVTVEGDVLSIQGRAELPRASARAQGLPETIAVEYRRAFQLTDTADADGIEASCSNGLVRVLVPRKKPAQRRITVSAR